MTKTQRARIRAITTKWDKYFKVHYSEAKPQNLTEWKKIKRLEHAKNNPNLERIRLFSMNARVKNELV